MMLKLLLMVYIVNMIVPYVTLTAGLGSSKSYQHIVPDVKQMCYWRSKLRALDSVTVPRWGGLATTQCVNLGYPDGDLAKLANDKTSVLSDEQTHSNGRISQLQHRDLVA